MRKINFKISAADNGRRIKDYLRDFGVSSALLTKLKQTENGITVNGAFARAIDILREGDTLSISVKNKGHMPAPLDIPLDILYEDEDLIAVNKPPFMPVHESRNHIGDTLSNAIAAHIAEDTAFRAVYRLDRDTSGIVLIAKNPLAAAKLAGKVKKDYYAIVKGEITESGVIDAPIARLDSSIIKRCVAEGGERAVTHYEPIKTKNGLTLLKISLETGRTHQIRVHFSHMGYPLWGDTLYGGDDERLNRQALHCKDISFIHPIKGADMHISCPFPDDFHRI